MLFPHKSLPFFLVPQSQGTEEQKEKWLEPAKDFRIMGAYAQTELGHGTTGDLLPAT